jgi:protein TonB
MEAKKNPQADVHSQRPLLFALSLVISLSLVIMAFEWRTERVEKPIVRSLLGNPAEDLLLIPPTEHLPPPPPPRIRQPDIVEVPDEEKVIEEVEVVFDQETTEVHNEKVNVVLAEAEQEDTDEIFLIVESPAEFPGGQAALTKYFVQNLTYPGKARRLGIEGRVFVTAVIEKDGSVSNAMVLKGIGGGCDEESVRLISSLPRWIPARQRGHAVRTKVTFPIIFKL